MLSALLTACPPYPTPGTPFFFFFFFYKIEERMSGRPIEYCLCAQTDAKDFPKSNLGSLYLLHKKSGGSLVIECYRERAGGSEHCQCCSEILFFFLSFWKLKEHWCSKQEMTWRLSLLAIPSRFWYPGWSMSGALVRFFRLGAACCTSH